MLAHVLLELVQADRILVLLFEHQSLQVLLPASKAGLQISMEFVNYAVHLILQYLEVAFI